MVNCIGLLMRPRRLTWSDTKHLTRIRHELIEWLLMIATTLLFWNPLHLRGLGNIFFSYSLRAFLRRYANLERVYFIHRLQLFNLFWRKNLIRVFLACKKIDYHFISKFSFSFCPDTIGWRKFITAITALAGKIKYGTTVIIYQ
jgi:hypothetical protein